MLKLEDPEHRMTLPERPPDTPPTTLERRVEGIQERALIMLVGHAINFPEYLFSRRCDFSGSSPQARRAT